MWSLPLVASTTACVLALIAVFWSSRPFRLARALRNTLNDVDARFDTLEARVKKLNAQHALIVARAKLEEQAQDDDVAMRAGEDPLEWKRRARRLIREGKVKIGGTD